MRSVVNEGLALDRRAVILQGRTYSLDLRAGSRSSTLRVRRTGSKTGSRLARLESCGGGTSVAAQRHRSGILLERLLDLDGDARRVLSLGGSVSKELPGTPRIPPNPEESWSADDYRDARPSVGELLRPLLLSEGEPQALFPYQRAGYRWLLAHNRGILADDMGLGKTLQAIAALRILVVRGEVRQALVVCPKSLIATWEDELRTWAPDLTHIRVTPGGDRRDEVWRLLRDRVHVIITNYEHLRRIPTALSDSPLDLLIADEAHRLRRAQSLISGSIRKLHATRLWALTGTPIERDPTDLATLLSIVAPQRFSPRDGTEPAALRAHGKRFILRRTKAQVLTDLPPAIESREPLDLLPAQRRSYVRVARGISDTKEPRGILATINLLRRICDYDAESHASAKLERIMELLEDIELSGEKAVVFSYLLEPLHELARRLKMRGHGDVYSLVEGEQSTTERARSIRSFKRATGFFVLLASSRIVSEGLTLTEANHVIFVNEWWNPSANRQARDRVVRIGQGRLVHIHTFQCRGTIEDELERILKEKSAATARVIDSLAEVNPDSINEDARTVIDNLSVGIARHRLARASR